MTAEARALASLPLDAVSHVTPFLELLSIGRLAAADKTVDSALRDRRRRVALLPHLDRGSRGVVEASTSLEHVALADAARDWQPFAAVRGEADLADVDAVNARCRQIAGLLRRHGTATVRVETHCGADVRPRALAQP